jgi:hypothetical protein
MEQRAVCLELERFNDVAVSQGGASGSQQCCPACQDGPPCWQHMLLTAADKISNWVVSSASKQHRQTLDLLQKINLLKSTSE